MTNPINELSGVLRSTSGKGPSHRLRKTGLMPAVVYGGGQNASSVAVHPREMAKLLKGPLRRNVMIHLNLEDETGAPQQTKTVMVRDVQVHPVKRSLTHVDFLEVDAQRPVAVSVPLIFFGKSKAVTAGGFLDQVSKTLKIRTLPGAIPEKIEIDVTELPFGATHAKQIRLPAGIELVDAPETTILTIRIPKAEEATVAAAPVEPTVIGAAPAEGTEAAAKGKE